VFNNGNSEKKDKIFRKNPEFYEAATKEVPIQKEVLMKIKK